MELLHAGHLAEGPAKGYTNACTDGRADGHIAAHDPGHAFGHAPGDAHSYTQRCAAGHEGPDTDGHAVGYAHGHIEGQANGRTDDQPASYVQPFGLMVVGEQPASAQGVVAAVSLGRRPPGGGAAQPLTVAFGEPRPPECELLRSLVAKPRERLGAGVAAVGVRPVRAGIEQPPREQGEVKRVPAGPVEQPGRVVRRKARRAAGEQSRRCAGFQQPDPHRLQHVREGRDAPKVGVDLGQGAAGGKDQRQPTLGQQAPQPLQKTRLAKPEEALGLVEQQERRQPAALLTLRTAPVAEPVRGGVGGLRPRRLAGRTRGDPGRRRSGVRRRRVDHRVDEGLMPLPLQRLTGQQPHRKPELLCPLAPSVQERGFADPPLAEQRHPAPVPGRPLQVAQCTGAPDEDRRQGDGPGVEGVGESLPVGHRCLASLRLPVG